VASHGWAGRLAASVSCIVLAAVIVCGDGSSSAQLGVVDLSGRQVEPLGASDARAVVFLFTRTDCPISNRYAPEVRRLYEKFALSGVTFWLVYPDPAESAEAIRRHIEEYQYPADALRDTQHALVEMTGVRVTPEAAVFVPGKAGARMVYRGRIDDRYVAFGTMRPAPTTHDLEQALEAVIEGKPVTSRTTAAIGCFISDLR
jgi:hypothetical protein